RAALGDLARDLAEDQRVDDRVEIAAAIGVGEDDRAEPLAVDRAVGREHVAPEGLDDALPALAPGRVDAVADLVGIDHVRAELGEHRADHALSGADAAGQADDHRLSLPPAERSNKLT